MYRCVTHGNTSRIARRINTHTSREITCTAYDTIGVTNGLQTIHFAVKYHLTRALFNRILSPLAEVSAIITKIEMTLLIQNVKMIKLQMLINSWIHSRHGTIERFKARFVVCGYSQIHGVDYEQSFSSTMRATTFPRRVPYPPTPD